MLHRRHCSSRRLTLLAAVALILVGILRVTPRFLPDEVADFQLRSHITKTYQLPTRGQAQIDTPRRIHFMHQTHMILPDYKQFIASWRRVYPNYEIYFWTDADLDRLVTSRYPQLAQFYRSSLTNPLERSDVSRVLILNSFGGWYSDLDAGCHANAENLTRAHSLIVPQEPRLHAMVLFNRRKLVNNAVMYSLPGHPYWLYYIRVIVSTVESIRARSMRGKDEAVFLTGPVTMTRAMNQFLSAHSDRCGPGNKGGGDFWCPTLPAPELFLPLIDETSAWLPFWASIMCRAVFGEPEVSAECRRFRATGFANQLPSNAYTYHAFLHLTGKRKFAARVNVSHWGLNIRLSPLEHLA